LWTQKYAPKSLAQFVGQMHARVELHQWIAQRKENPYFGNQCCTLCGPAGSGTTTLARLALEQHGYKVLVLTPLSLRVGSGCSSSSSSSANSNSNSTSSSSGGMSASEQQSAIMDVLYQTAIRLRNMKGERMAIVLEQLDGELWNNCFPFATFEKLLVLHNKTVYEEIEAKRVLIQHQVKASSNNLDQSNRDLNSGIIVTNRTSSNNITNTSTNTNTKNYSQQLAADYQKLYKLPQAYAQLLLCPIVATLRSEPSSSSTQQKRCHAMIYPKKLTKHISFKMPYDSAELIAKIIDPILGQEQLVLPADVKKVLATSYAQDIRKLVLQLQYTSLLLPKPSSSTIVTNNNNSNNYLQNTVSVNLLHNVLTPQQQQQQQPKLNSTVATAGNDKTMTNNNNNTTTNNNNNNNNNAISAQLFNYMHKLPRLFECKDYLVQLNTCQREWRFLNAHSSVTLRLFQLTDRLDMALQCNSPIAYASRLQKYNNNQNQYNNNNHNFGGKRVGGGTNGGPSLASQGLSANNQLVNQLTLSEAERLLSICSESALSDYYWSKKEDAGTALIEYGQLTAWHAFASAQSDRNNDAIIMDTLQQWQSQAPTTTSRTAFAFPVSTSSALKTNSTQLQTLQLKPVLFGFPLPDLRELALLHLRQHQECVQRKGMQVDALLTEFIYDLGISELLQDPELLLHAPSGSGVEAKSSKKPAGSAKRKTAGASLVPTTTNSQHLLQSKQEMLKVALAPMGKTSLAWRALLDLK
jgi:hypothetical protein